MKKIIFLFFLIGNLIFARNIYIGDKIKIEVSGMNISQIKDGFKNSKFSIDELKEIDKDKYEVIFHTFDIGENSLILGNKKITVDVKSSITPKDKDIYRDLSDLSNKKLYISKFPYINLISIVLFIGSLIYLLKNIKFYKKKRKIDKEEIYNNRMKNIDSKNWDENLSFAIREYIDNTYKTHFLNGFYEVKNKITEDDISFLNLLDEYKFSDKDGEYKEKYIKKVNVLHDKIRGDENV